MPASAQGPWPWAFVPFQRLHRTQLRRQEGEEQAAPAPATDAAPASSSGNDTAIVITAQKRSENVQKVPISVAAFSGQTLAKSNVNDISQIGKLASNYQATKAVQSSFMRVNIRGIGAIGNTTIEPSVAIFVDGAYVPRAGAVVSSLLDIESVEVLRGPQGTLFGRNASVGALSLHSAQPRLGEVSARVTGEIGTGDRRKVDGYLNLPVGDNMAVRVAGLHQNFQGYWHNKLDDKTYGGTTDDVFRASFRGSSDRSTGSSAPIIPTLPVTAFRTSSSTGTQSAKCNSTG